MENITETVVNEATPVIEATVDAAAKAVTQPKARMSIGQKLGVGAGLTLLVGGAIWAGTKLHAKVKKSKAKEQGYDNVDIAKRDFLDVPEEDTAEEE